MEHKPVFDLQAIADIRPIDTLPPMSREQRLKRWIRSAGSRSEPRAAVPTTDRTPPETRAPGLSRREFTTDRSV